MAAALELLRQVNNSACEYLLWKTDMSKWQLLYAASSGARLFGMKTSNLAEIEHARDAKLGHREKGPLWYLQGLLETQQSTLRKMKESLWERMESESLLSKLAEDGHKKMDELLRSVIVKEGTGPSIYETKTMDSNKEKSWRAVDLTKPFFAHGGCLHYHQFMQPCHHFIAAWNKHASSSGGDVTCHGFDSISQFFKCTFHQCYLIENCQAAVLGEHICLPSIDTILPDETILPPVEYSKVQKRKRVKQKRILSRGEKEVSHCSSQEITKDIKK